MRWISASQQQRDHAGLRNVCAADGHEGTPGNPLGLSKDGSRVHRAHFADPTSGFYGDEQGDGTRWTLTAPAGQGGVLDKLDPNATHHTIAVYGRADLDRRLAEAARLGVQVTYQRLDTDEDVA